MADTNGNPAPDRLAELERENERLRAELRSMQTWHQVERVMLDAFSVREIPLTAEDINRVMDSGVSMSDLIAEAECETGTGGAA